MDNIMGDKPKRSNLLLATAADVRELHDKAKSQLATYHRRQANAEALTNLQKMISQAVEAEDGFLKLFRINQSRSISERFRELASIIKKLSEENARDFTNYAPAELDNFIATLLSNTVTGSDRLIFNATTEAVSEFEKKDSFKDMEDKISEAFERVAKDAGLSIGLEKRRARTSDNIPDGVTSLYKLIYSRTKKASGDESLIEYKIIPSKNSPKLSAAVTSQIANTVNTAISKTDGGRVTMKDFLSQYISNHCSNELVKVAMLDEINNNWDSYTFTSDEKQLKGALGELKTNAILRALLVNSDDRVISVGTIKGTKQFSVDTIIRDYGIQVKNISVNDMGDVMLQSSYLNAATFINQVINDNASVAEILHTLFASYQYNQPLMDDTAAEQFKDDATGYSNFIKYKNLYEKGIKDDTTNLTNYLFGQYIDNILRVQNYKLLPAIANELGVRESYRNTVFMFGSQLIPASLLLQGLYNELKTDAAKGVYYTSMFHISKPLQPLNDSSNILTYETSYPRGLNENQIITAENSIKIRPIITIHLGKMLKNLLTKTYS